MNSKQIAGIVIVIVGIGMIIGSNYIKGQVEQGKIQISSAQRKVDKSNSLFSINPVSKEIGKGITGSAQRKINAGEDEVAHYEEIAKWLNIGGIGAIVVGGVVFFLGLSKKRKH